MDLQSLWSGTESLKALKYVINLFPKVNIFFVALAQVCPKLSQTLVYS